MSLTLGEWKAAVLAAAFCPERMIFRGDSVGFFLYGTKPQKETQGTTERKKETERRRIEHLAFKKKAKREKTRDARRAAAVQETCAIIESSSLAAVLHVPDNKEAHERERKAADHLAEAFSLYVEGRGERAAREIKSFFARYPQQVKRLFLYGFIKIPLTSVTVDDIEEEFCSAGLTYAIELGLCYSQWKHLAMHGDLRSGFSKSREWNGLRIRLPQSRGHFSYCEIFNGSGMLGRRHFRLLKSLHKQGMSFRSISETLWEVFGYEVAPSTLKVYIQPFYHEIEARGKRDLRDFNIFAILLDGTHDSADIILPPKEDGGRGSGGKRKRKRGRALLTAIGLYMDHEGIKMAYLGCKSVKTESAENYIEFVKELIARGLFAEGVGLILSDRHKSFAGLRDKLFPQAKLSYCGVHLTRNLGKKIPKSAKKKGKASVFLKSAYWVLKGSTKAEVWERFSLFRAAYHEDMRDAVEYLRQNIESHTNSTDFFNHPEIIRFLLNTNRIESMNRLISRWADWKGGFRSIAEQERAGHLAGMRMEESSQVVLSLGRGECTMDEDLVQKEEDPHFRAKRLRENSQELKQLCIDKGKEAPQELGGILYAVSEECIRQCNEWLQ
jgi:hypothetical protein